MKLKMTLAFMLLVGMALTSEAQVRKTPIAPAVAISEIRALLYGNSVIKGYVGGDLDSGCSISAMTLESVFNGLSLGVRYSSGHRVGVEIATPDTKVMKIQDRSNYITRFDITSPEGLKSIVLFTGREDSSDFDLLVVNDIRIARCSFRE